MSEQSFQKRVTVVSVLCLTVLFFISSVWANQTNPLLQMEIPSSPNPVGSGARALGMGGAFIAIADDATAASWNPGGLIQLDYPETSVVYSYVRRREENTFGGHPEASGPGSVDASDLDYLSVVYPFEFGKYGRNMNISLNYQHLYDFNRHWILEWDDPDLHFTGPMQYNYEQKGDLYALGLAYSVQVNLDLSVGVTLNYWGDFLSENRWEQKYHQAWEEIFTGGVHATTIQNKKEEFSFNGWNANLGFFWQIGKHWTLGGVFKTPFTADIDHTVTKEETVIAQGKTTSVPPVEKQSNEKLRMPMSYGIGLAYRFSDEFTIAGDIYRTHWNDFELEDEQGNKTSPVSGKEIEDSDIDPTTWFRVGAEYLMIGEEFLVPLRAGIFYDPAPAEGSPDDYYGFSLGTGLVYERPGKNLLYKRLVFDVAYQFRFGNDVGGSMLQHTDFSQDIREHKVYTSLIVHFE